MATATLRSPSTRRGFAARLRSLLNRTKLGLLLALAFILPPLLVGGAGAARAFVGRSDSDGVENTRSSLATPAPTALT